MLYLIAAAVIAGYIIIYALARTAKRADERAEAIIGQYDKEGD